MSVTDQDIKIHHEIEGLPAGNYDLQNIKSKQFHVKKIKRTVK